MDFAVLISFLINILVINSQVYLNEANVEKENFKLNPNDFANITDDEINFLLKVMETETEAPHIHDTSKYCSSFGSCQECVKSMWFPCDWCHDYGCTDKSHELCSVLYKETNDHFRNVSNCPYIFNDKPILVPASLKKQIEVKVSVPDPALLEKELLCQVKLQDRLSHTKGIILDNKVYCYPIKLMVSGTSEVGYFRVLWGGVQPISNELPLLVYHCESMAKECEDCRMLPKEYGCGWCQDTQMCSLPNKCNDLLSWSLNKMTCQFNRQIYFV